MNTENEPQNQDIKLGVRVSWQVTKTDSDIQIVGGSTTVSQNGTIVGSQVIQTPQGAGIILIIAGDDKAFHIVEAGVVKIL